MRYIIENDYLLVEVSDLGATLTKFIDKQTRRDLVIGFDSDEGYIKYSGTNIGATIGRNCNRIKDAKFELNGKTYYLSKNDGENNLHGGGVDGFGFKKFTLKESTNDKLVFTYLSKDMEAGFPGNVDVTTSYILDGNSLTIKFEGTTDQDTVFNMTNHAYFSLGDENIYNQKLHITTDKYSPVDEFGMTLDTVEDVEGTGFDFTEFRELQDNLIKLDNGIDNNYVWENMDDKLMCEIKNDYVQMNVYSDLPDMHIYTANYLETDEGKYGKKYHRRGAICFECQFYPNAVNYKQFISPILKAHESSSHYMRYEIKH